MDTSLCHRRGDIVHCMGTVKQKWPNNLKAAMKAKGIGTTELARLSDQNKQTVHRFIHGMQELTKPWADKFAPHLDTTSDQLLYTFSPKIADDYSEVDDVIRRFGEVYIKAPPRLKKKMATQVKTVLKAS